MGQSHPDQEVFDLWKSSSGHNANLLTPNFKAIGIARGYGPGTAYLWYWVADFGGEGVPSPPPTPSPTPTATPPATPSPSRFGDVDCDGDVDAVDALSILRHVANLGALGDCLVLGDVDCTDGIGAADALAILRYLVGRPR